ncbi:MAG: hypothetical protein M1155_02210, partial [Patescibacteria group bacterium]|nr:hypothetical protein [Patescibacteria group bacterium]
MKVLKNKLRVGILGATGMVGQRFISLLDNHPWFNVVVLAASPQSAGKKYGEVMKERWSMKTGIPEGVKNIIVRAVEEDFDEIVGNVDPHTKRESTPLASGLNNSRYGVGVDLVFSAIDFDPVRNSSPIGPSGALRAGVISNGVDKNQLIREIEERYAAAGVAVISNNSAHRWTEDVPMIMPELNADHLDIIDIQRKNRGWLNARGASPDSAKRNLGKGGFIVVKPNCSLQSYLPVIYALKKFGPRVVSVTTLQAISGAGKTFESWPEMADNCIPFIGGEEEKTEKEPLKILGSIKGKKIIPSKEINISATCIRVAVSDGHMASVAVKFKRKPTKEQIIDAIENFKNPFLFHD